MVQSSAGIMLQKTCTGILYKEISGKNISLIVPYERREESRIS